MAIDVYNGSVAFICKGQGFALEPLALADKVNGPSKISRSANPVANRRVEEHMNFILLACLPRKILANYADAIPYDNTVIPSQTPVRVITVCVTVPPSSCATE